MDTNNLSDLQQDLAVRSHWNIGFFIAGFLFWTYAAIVGSLFDLAVAKTYWLVGTFFIFPVAVVASKLVGADPFTKGNKLADLVGFTHMSVIALSFPMVIASYVYNPELMLLVMGICYCIDFYVMSWAFGSRIFGIHAAVRMLAITLVWFFLPELRLLAIPLVIALAYIITVLLIPSSRKGFLKGYANQRSV
jgi:hypothetical protein